MGNQDIVMLLLQHGASVDSVTKDQYTSLHIAAKEDQEEVGICENSRMLGRKCFYLSRFIQR